MTAYDSITLACYENFGNSEVGKVNGSCQLVQFAGEVEK